MAFPQQLGAQNGTGAAPIFKASNGSYYALGMFSASSKDWVGVYKTSDPSTGWAVLDSASTSAPQAASGKGVSLIFTGAMEGTGRFIGCAWVEGTTVLYLSVFDTQFDIWSGRVSVYSPGGPAGVAFTVAGEAAGSTSWCGAASGGTHFAVAYCDSASGQITIRTYNGSGTLSSSTAVAQTGWSTNTNDVNLTTGPAMSSTVSWDGSTNRFHVFAKKTGTGVISLTAKLDANSPSLSSKATVCAAPSIAGPHLGQAVVNSSTVFMAGVTAGAATPCVYKATVADSPTWSSELVSSTQLMYDEAQFLTFIYGPGLAVDPSTGEMYYQGIVAAQGAAPSAFAADNALWKRSSGGSWGATHIINYTNSPAAAALAVYTRSATLRVGCCYYGNITEYDTGAASANFLRGYDTVTVSDVALKTGPQRTGTDSVLVSDAATIPVAPGTAQDTVTISDAATRTSARARTASESVSVSDAATRTAAHPRTASDPVTVSDAATRSAMADARTAADSVTVSDAAARLDAAARTASDTTAVSDSASRGAVSPARTATDAVTVSDNAAGTRGASRTASDAVTVSDAAVRGGAANSRTGADSVTIGDQAVRGAIHWASSGSDSVTISDAVTTTTGKSGGASDTVTVSDAATHGSTGGSRTASDSISVSDVTARGVIHYARTAQDLVTIGDRAAWLAPQSDVIVSVPAYTAATRITLTRRSLVSEAHRRAVRVIVR